MHKDPNMLKCILNWNQRFPFRKHLLSPNYSEEVTPLWAQGYSSHSWPGEIVCRFPSFWQVEMGRLSFAEHPVPSGAESLKLPTSVQLPLRPLSHSQNSRCCAVLRQVIRRASWVRKPQIIAEASGNTVVPNKILSTLSRSEPFTQNYLKRARCLWKYKGVWILSLFLSLLLKGIFFLLIVVSPPTTPLHLPFHLDLRPFCLL